MLKNRLTKFLSVLLAVAILIGVVPVMKATERADAAAGDKFSIQVIEKGAMIADDAAVECSFSNADSSLNESGETGNGGVWESSYVIGTVYEGGNEFTFTVDGESFTVEKDMTSAEHYLIFDVGSNTYYWSEDTVTSVKLVSIDEISAITDVENGVSKTASALGLPDTVVLNTEPEKNVEAEIDWDVSGCSYDSSDLKKQSFTVSGAVTLPEGVINPDGVSLNVTVSVSVLAGDDARFTTQPDGSTTLTVGDTLNLRVAATKIVKDSYQWYKDGVKLDGQNSNVLEIENVVLDDAGTYTCSVMGENGKEIVSDEAKVVINKASAELELTSNLESPQKRPLYSGLVLTATGIDSADGGEYIFYVNGEEKLRCEDNTYTFVPDTAEDSYTFKVVFTGNDKYSESEASLAFELEKSNQSPIYINNPITGNEITYGEHKNFTFSATGASESTGELVFEVVDQTDLDGNPADDIATVDSKIGSLKILRAGKFAVSVKREGDNDYNESNTAKTDIITVKKADQSGFKFENEAPETVVYNSGDNTFTNKASGGDGTGKITYAVKEDNGVATISDSSDSTVIINKAGTFTVIAIKAGDENYNEATAEYTLTVEKAAQSIAFEILPEESKTEIEVYYGEDFTNRAVEVAVEGAADNSGYGSGEITYTVESGDAVLKVEDGKVSFKDEAVGTVTIKAVKAECEKYLAAEATYTLTILEKSLEGDYYKAIEGTNSETGNVWFTSDVTIVPIDGYKISTSKSRDANWEDQIVISTEGEENETVIYLRDENGAIITAGCTIPAERLKIDKNAPEELDIEYSAANWYDDIANVIFFGNNDLPLQFTVSAKDTVSGIVSFEWKFSEKESDSENPAVLNGSAGSDEINYRGDSASATFDLPIEDIEKIRGNISFTVYDAAGNYKSMADETTVVYDTAEPNISIEYIGDFRKYINKTTNEDALEESEETARVYKGDLQIKVMVEEDFFYDDVIVKVNGTEKDCTFTEDDGKWVTVLDFTDGEYTLEVTHTDKSGNAADPLKADFIVVSESKAVVDVELKAAAEPKEGKYYTDDVTAVISVTDEYFNNENAVFSIVSATDIGGNSVDISTDFAAILADKANWTVTEENTYSVSVIISNEAIYKIKAEYTDLSGEPVSKESDEFVLDKTAPDSANITITYDENTVSNKLYDVLRAITFNYYNAPVEIKVSAKDTVSGIESISLAYAKAEDASDVNSVSWEETSTNLTYSDDGATATAVFNVPADASVQIDGLFTADATDRAGHSSAEKTDSENRVVVDTISPERTVEYGEIKRIVDEATGEYLEEFKEGDAVDVYYQNSAKLTFTVTEANFYGEDINSENTELKNMNCAIIVSKDGGEAQEITPESWSKNGDVYTGSITLEDEGRYVVTMNYNDRSGNAMKTYTTPELIIDNTAPVITSKVKNESDAENGIYYNENAVVAITVNETNFDASEISTVVFAKDILGADIILENNYFDEYLKNDSSWTEVSEGVYEAEITLSEDARYILNISGGDLAVNSSAEYASGEIVVDKTAPDSDKIIISYAPENLINKIIRTVTFNYYNPDVKVIVTAEDDVAGVDSIMLSYERAADASAVNTETWEETATDLEFSEDGKTAKAEFTVPAQLRGAFTAMAADKAGNDSENKVDAENIIIVDSIAPGRTVEYGDIKRIVNNESGKDAASFSAGDDVTVYYKDTATLTFKVEEANFYAEDINAENAELNNMNCVITVSKDGGEDQAITPEEWVKDGDVYTGSITLGGDGEYVVTMDYNDRSGNAMETYTSPVLVIDSTSAEISAEIENTEVRNDKYYNEDVTLTVTVKEVNFRADEVDFEITSAKDISGNEVVLSKDYNEIFKNSANWTSDGDVHTATVVIPDDANYTFAIDYTDLSGIAAEKYESDEFVLDKTAPDSNNIAITYAPENLINKILRTITFNYYNPEAIIVVTAEDETAGIESITLSYENDTDASEINGYADTESTDITYSEDGKIATATFKVPANTDGVFSAAAKDKAGNDSRKKTDNDNVIIVDNIAPGLTVEYGKVSRREGNKILFGKVAEITFKVEEANFYGEDINAENTELEGMNCSITVSKDGGEAQKVTPEEWIKDGDVYSGTITIEIDDGVSSYYVNMDYNDRSGNAMEHYTSPELVLDVEAAVVEAEIVNADEAVNEKYFSSERTLNVTVTEENFYADKVNFMVTATDVSGNAVNLSKDYNKYFSTQDNWISEGNVHTASIVIPDDAQYKIRIEYTDVDNTVAETEVSDFVVDKTAPVNVTLEYKESVFSAVISSITFGYFNPDVTVIATAEDITSGIDFIDLKYAVADGVSDVNTKDWNETVTDPEISADGKTATAEFKIPAQLNGSFTAIATDMAGNDTENADTEKRIVVDSITPERSVEIEYERAFDAATDEEITGDAKDAIKEGDNVVLFSKESAELTFTVDEANFYEEDITVKVNGEASDITWEKEENSDIYTASVVLDENGDYVVTAEYADRSGNNMETYTSPKIVIDNEAPVITVEFDRLSVSNGKYYNQNRSAKIRVTERYLRAEDVDFVLISTDITGAEVNVSTDFAELLKQKSSWTKEGGDYVAEITFSDDAHYKFTINCEDMAANTATYTSEDFVVDKTDPSDLKISYSYSTFRTVINSITFLYFNPSVTVTLTAEDVTAGIDHFDWTYSKESGASATNASSERGTVTDISYSSGGKVARGSFDLPEGDTAEQYRGNISFNATDRANNVSDTYEDEDTIIVIDTISPTRSVEFSPAKQVVEAATLESVENYVYTTEGSLQKLIYDASSTATITVTEANFYPEDVTVLVNDVETSDVQWTNSGDVWTGVVTFPQDGHYVLKLEYTDRAENEMVEYVSNEVIIDSVNPIIDVSYSPANAITGSGGEKYYNEDQTATIKITEHNFRASDVIVTVTAEDISGNNVDIGDIAAELMDESSWTHNDDVHTATIHYSKDANYTFDIEYTDLSMRMAEDYATDIFTVDTTAPKIDSVSYSQAVKEGDSIRYYNSAVIVTVKASDDTSGVGSIDYTYGNIKGETISIDKSSGGTITQTFRIPKEEFLNENNQFNGYVTVSASDRANNKSEDYKDTVELVVDNINPDATISYNTADNVVNGVSYYSGDIIATVEVTEKNFFEEDVQIFVNGTPRTVSSWSSSGNVHTGSFSISEDGDYIVSVKYKDRSNNQMDDYESEQLTIDRTAPVVTVSGIRNETAYNDEKIGFVVRAEDTNMNAAELKPVLTAVVQTEDGGFSQETISMSGVQTVEGGKVYTVSVDNLEKDAVYTLRCTAADMAGNSNENIYVSDGGAQLSQVMFSVNRNGSAYMLDEYTQRSVDKYYVDNVDNDIVIIEVNVNDLESYTVELNGEELVEGVDYTVSKDSGNGSWSKYSYSVEAALFAEEGEYSVVVTSIDKTNTTAYSDIKNAKVKFVVDRTAPVVTVSGIEKDGRYRTDKQMVTVIPADDGGKLSSIKIVLKGNDEVEDTALLELNRAELLTALDENGMLTFEIEEGMYQNIEIICIDEAGNEYNSGDAYHNVTVSPSGWIILWANPVFRWSLFGGAAAIAAGIIFLIFFKKKKKEEKDK